MDRQLRKDISFLRNHRDKLVYRCEGLELRRKQIVEVKNLYIGNPHAKPLYDVLIREDLRLLGQTTDMMAEINGLTDKLGVLYYRVMANWTGTAEDEARLAVEDKTLGVRMWIEYRELMNQLYQRN